MMSASKRKINSESLEMRKKKSTKDTPWRGELGPCIEIPERVERVFYHEYVVFLKPLYMKRRFVDATSLINLRVDQPTPTFLV